jgi:kynurenine 3-monooxygenase
MKPINIIGAGLAGSLMAVLLAKKGFRVNVYERRPDMRKAKIGGGRSINLALSARGIHALEEAGLKEEIMKLAIPMPGRMIHPVQGGEEFQPYSKDPSNHINSVSRAELNKKLMDRAEVLEKVDFFFNHRCLEMDFESGKVLMKNEENGETFELEGKTTIAADGAFSAVRYAMQKTPRFNFSQSYLDHGYKELEIPPTADGGFRMEPKALHIWPRDEFMMIALPNLDGSFTCTLFMAYEGKNSFANLQSKEEVTAFFNTQFPDAVPLMPNLLDDFFTNPTSSLVTVRCYPWAYGDKVALIGDASHAIVPFFGQGMNAAFEDCSVMSECIDQAEGDWAKAFDAYQKSRKANADAIATMALENYIEMRDHVNDEEFVFQKKVEHHLERHTDLYQSRYEMVSFSRIPYAEAYRRGELNKQILGRITDGIDQAAEIDMERAERIIQEVMGEGGE